ncbi:myb domain protein 3r-3 [Striga asiatica]|uniref:Myb domain protein 3r-3 n=1 Tax=Striga asiatica TaxID=4170 RepID=A0A5A7Q9P5_STRAF|nr:myb domain protein 3r-3 [Striga asiatica]
MVNTAVPEEGKVANPPPPLPLLRELMAEIHRLPLDAAASPPQKVPWPMVSIRNHQDDDDGGGSYPPIIFPPINHENLQIHTEKSPISQKLLQISADCRQPSFSDYDSHSDSDSSSSSSEFSPSYSSPSSPSPLPGFSDLAPASAAVSPGRWIDSWSETLRAKGNSIVRIIWTNLLGSSRGTVLAFRSAALAAALFAFLYFRRRRTDGNSLRLVGIIKEKDEKINQLLDQISRMNQILLALHNKVPNGSTR